MTKGKRKKGQGGIWFILKKKTKVNWTPRRGERVGRSKGESPTQKPAQVEGARRNNHGFAREGMTTNTCPQKSTRIKKGSPHTTLGKSAGQRKKPVVRTKLPRKGGGGGEPGKEEAQRN